MPDPILRSLVGRLETEEPARELDAEIAAALRILPAARDCPDWLSKCPHQFAAFPDGTIREDFGNGKFGFTWESARLTSSIDAKLAGEDDGYWIIRGPHKKRWHACYHPPGTGAGWDGEAGTEAMARRAAYLKSKLAEKEARDDTATNERAQKKHRPRRTGARLLAAEFGNLGVVLSNLQLFRIAQANFKIMRQHDFTRPGAFTGVISPGAAAHPGQTQTGGARQYQFP